MTKIDLITGFLGVGKTTFIKKYADFLTSKGEKVHIIENEFGGLPIDSRILGEENLDVSQITGGCMCCTGRVSFKNLLLQAAKAGFDRVLVEPSGIYDVNEFFKMIQNPPVNSVCSIGNIITIVDSKSDDILSPEAKSLMLSQLAYTGCVIVSKTQLREPSETTEALDELQKLLSESGSDRNLESEHLCITKAWDDLTDSDMNTIVTCGYRATSYSTAELMDHMSIFKTSMLCEMFDTLENLDKTLHELLNTEKYGKVYRIKGFISDTNNKWYEINCSPSGCFVKEANIQRGMFIIIGQDYDEAEIKKLFISRR